MKLLCIFAACLALGVAQETDLGLVTSLNNAPREVLFQTNKPLEVGCGITTELGKNVKYEWQKNGKALSAAAKGVSTGHDGALALQSPDESTQGMYECLATSELGVASSGPIAVRRMYINAPKIETKKHTPVEGEPFQLECPQVNAYPPAEIAWMKQEKNGPLKNLFGIRLTPGPNNVLYFSNVTEEDVSKDSKYVCVTVHVASDETVVLAEHVIEGLKDGSKTGLKKAVPQYLSNNIIAKEGDRTFIYCIYGGAIAPPDYFLDDKNVNGDDNPGKQRVTRHNRSKGRRLLIKETRQEDRGTYTCKIAEADGSSTDHIIRLAVISKPTYLKKSDAKITAKSGEDVVIPCQVKAVPKPNIVWTYNNKPLPASDGVTFSVTEKSGEQIGDLRIKGVQKNHGGYYGCKASNEFGDVYIETLLSVV